MGISIISIGSLGSFVTGALSPQCPLSIDKDFPRCDSFFPSCTACREHSEVQKKKDNDKDIDKYND